VRSAPFLALVALEIDQLSKLGVRETLELGESIPREGSLHLTRVVNPGVVFGIPASPTVSLVLPVAVILVCLLIYWRFERSNSVLLNIGIGLFVGGSLGNLVDRIAYGQVTDFVELTLRGGDVTLVFNVADLCVVLGIVALEIFLIGVIIGLIRKRGMMYNPMMPFIARHIGRRGSRGK
jgi:signal peptidase II